jgi:AcrR family transcriptional regulator
MYHHFADKQDLFRAVFEAVEIDLMARVAAAIPAGLDAWDSMRIGLGAFVDAAAEREVQQVVLLDGPVVLGWTEWRALEARFGLGAIEAALRDATTRGLIRPQPVGALAHLVLAAVDEAALLVANAEDPAMIRAEVTQTLNRLLNGLHA